MGCFNSRLSLLYSWFLVLVLSAGFCLGFAVSADAQLPENTLLDTTFNIDRWKKHGPRSVTVYYGEQVLLSTEFTYNETTYKVRSISSAGFPTNKVKIDITPSFPPGPNESYFSLYVGSVSENGELRRFNFGDANNNEWPGRAGFQAGYIKNDDVTQNGRLKITAIDESIGEHLGFADYFPNPTTNSSDENIGGRLQVVDDENIKRWRICNRDGDDFIEEAKVACRQMDLPLSDVSVLDITTVTEAEYPEGFGTAEAPTVNAFLYTWQSLGVYHTPVLLDNIKCTGDEEKLIECDHLGLGVVSGGYCPVANTAVVLCGD